MGVMSFNLEVEKMTDKDIARQIIFGKTWLMLQLKQGGNNGVLSL